MDLLVVDFADILDISTEIIHLAVIPSINLPILISLINQMRILNFPNLQSPKFLLQLHLSILYQIAIPFLINDIRIFIIIEVIG